MRSLLVSSRLVHALGVVAAVFIATSACVRTDCANNDLLCDNRLLLWPISDCPTTTSWHTFLGGAANNSTVIEARPDGLGGSIVAGIAADDFINNPRRAFTGAPGTLNNFLVQLSPNGIILWGTYLGATAPSGMGLTVGEEGITLLSDSTATFGGPINAFQGGAADILVARLSLDGDLIWHTFQGGAGADQAAKIERRSDGGFWLVGAMPNAAGGAAGTALFAHPSPGVDAAFVQRLDANGNAINHSFFGSTNPTSIRALAVTAANELYALGGTNSALSGAYPNTIVNFSGGASDDGLLIKLSSDGGYLYHTFQGEATGAQGFTAGAVQSDGSIITVGSSPATFGTPLSPFSGGSQDIVISRYRPDGSLLWLSFAGGTGADSGDSIGTSRNGGAYIGGSSDASFGTPVSPFVHNGGGANHGVVFGIDANGIQGPPLFFGTAAATVGTQAILETCEGGLLLANRSSDAYGSRPLVPFGGGPLNGLLIRLDAFLQLSTF